MKSIGFFSPILFSFGQTPYNIFYKNLILISKIFIDGEELSFMYSITK
jgi:hypothetical protein